MKFILLLLLLSSCEGLEKEALKGRDNQPYLVKQTGYILECLDGLLLVSKGHGSFYKLDTNGKPIFCIGKEPQ